MAHQTFSNKMFIRKKFKEFVKMCHIKFPESFLVYGGYWNREIMIDEILKFVPHSCNKIYISDSKNLNCAVNSNHCTTLTRIGHRNIYSGICSNVVNSYDLFASILAVQWNNKTKNSISTLYQKMNVEGLGIFVVETRNYIVTIFQRLSPRAEWKPYVDLLLSEERSFYDDTDLYSDVEDAFSNAGFDDPFSYSAQTMYEFLSLEDIYDYFNKRNKKLKLSLSKEVYNDLFLNVLMELGKDFLINFDNNGEVTIKIPIVETTVFFRKVEESKEEEEVEENEVSMETPDEQKQQVKSENNPKQPQVKRKHEVQDEVEAKKLRPQENRQMQHKQSSMKPPEKEKQYVKEKRNLNKLQVKQNSKKSEMKQNEEDKENQDPNKTPQERN